jgi:hypothetical protein
VKFELSNGFKNTFLEIPLLIPAVFAFLFVFRLPELFHQVAFAVAVKPWPVPVFTKPGSNKFLINTECRANKVPGTVRTCHRQ